MKSNTLKRTGAFLLCACSVLAGWAQDIHTALLSTKSGDKVAIALSEKPTVSFTTTDVVLTTAQQTLSYPLAEQVSLTFGTYTPDGLAEVGSLSAVIACRNGRVEVSHAKPGTPVALYTTDGKLMQQTEASAAGTAQLSLGQTGIGVVRVGERTVKVLGFRN